jgi:alpha-glucosidase
LLQTAGRQYRATLRDLQSKAFNVPVLRVFALTFLAVVPSTLAQSPASFLRVGNVTAVALLPNGIEVHAGPAAMRVEALREDVLRIRITPDGHWQEDASWAVLPGRTKSSALIRPFSTSTEDGFDTSALHVIVERAPLRLVIEDHDGHVLSADAPGRPVVFDGPRDVQGGEFRVFKQLHPDEHFFGLGDKTGPLDRRGEAFVDWNTDAYLFQAYTDPLYKSIPFFLGETGGRYYGLYLDNTWRASFDFGKDLLNAYSFGSDGGPLDYYFLAGPEPKKVVETWAWLTGPSPLPPLWSMGYQQSRYSYAPEAKLRDVATRLRADKIPTDVLWLDIDYQDRDRPFTTDPTGYPNFPKTVADLRADGFHIVAITDLHVADVPGEHYAPYDAGAAGDHFVKNPDGSVYVGESWPGKVVFPDFTQTSARKWWGTNFQAFVADGVAGFWNDMNEPSIRNEVTGTMPLATVHRVEGTGFAARLASHREVHNVFGAQNARATYEGVLALAPNERPYVMTRAAFAGAQRYSVTWTGDNSSTWSQLRLSTDQLLNLGLSGFAFAGADVGGHVGSPQPELLTKWLEVAAFQPIDRNHAAKSSNQQEVWVHGPHAEDVARKYIEARYRLMPYLYTVAEETSRTGLPLLRPLFLEFPNVTRDHHPVDIDAQGEFMVGADILVAPPAFFDTENKYSPTLPGDGWYDFWTGLRLGPTRSLAEIASEATEFSPSTRAHVVPASPLAETKAERKKSVGNAAGLQIQPTTDDLPVFVRAGSILPMESVIQNTGETPSGPLQLHVYPGPVCSGSLYSDDGHTFNFQHGDFLRIGYSCQASSAGLRITLGAREGSFAPWWKQVEVIVYGAAPGWKAMAGARAVLASTFDSANQSFHVVVPEQAAATTITINGAP